MSGKDLQQNIPTISVSYAGMANNLNQLAHKANAGGFDTAKLECRVQVARIEELLNHILL